MKKQLLFVFSVTVCLPFDTYWSSSNDAFNHQSEKWDQRTLQDKFKTAWSRLSWTWENLCSTLLDVYRNLDHRKVSINFIIPYFVRHLYLNSIFLTKIFLLSNKIILYIKRTYLDTLVAKHCHIWSNQIELYLVLKRNEGTRSFLFTLQCSVPMIVFT